ncbi:MAG: NifB/NifX family molybdenum-iron cluster-binding protein [bacterium]
MVSQKVAVTSEDGKQVGSHFGKTPYFVVFTVKDGEVVNRELRQNTFTTHARGTHGADEQRGHGQGGHSCGSGIVKGLSDCQTLICGGIGQGAIHTLQNAGMQIISTKYLSVDQSLKAYLDGQLNQEAEPCRDGKTQH